MNKQYINLYNNLIKQSGGGEDEDEDSSTTSSSSDKKTTKSELQEEMEEAVEIADRTYILEDGKIALHGGKEILKDKRIKNIYFGGR